MAVGGLLITGYMLHQRGSAAAPARSGAVSRAERAGGDVAEKPAAKSVHDPRASKIHAVNEPREDDKWLGVHNKYSYELETKAKAGTVKAVFYGDATFEAFRGSKIGIHQPSLDAAAAAWTSHFKAHSLALAVSGDTASNVLWRIRNGEWPSAVNPKVIVVSVGTNDIKRAAVEGEPADLEAGTVPGKALADATAAIVGTVLEDVPSAHVLIVAVPPRGDEGSPDKHAQPSKYTPSINAANKALAEYAAKHAAHVSFVDCNAGLLDGSRISASAMPDGVHIAPDAYEAWAGGCLAPAVNKALAA
jgi:lysophospholipase L1-like esterase